MFYNELYQGGIRAILDADNTIFNNMVVPSGISVKDAVDNIIFKYGDAPLFSPDPDVMKYYIGVWSKKRLPQWERFYKAISIEYEPLENYDRREERTNAFTHGHTIKSDDDLTHGLTVENQISADNATTYQNDSKGVNSGTDQRDIKEEHSGTDNTRETIRAHGNIGVTTSQQMLQSELDLIPELNLLDYIAEDFHTEFCLMVYN